MLTIIHGDDISTSRKFFLEQKKNLADAILLESEKVNLTDLVQIFEGGGLFDNNKNVFIERLLTKNKKSKETSQLFLYLEKQSAKNAVFLWEGKELERSSLSIFKSATIRAFKLPQSLFLFLDSLKPGYGKTIVSFFHATIETSEVEIVFFMLIRQMRLMLALIESSDEEIDELKRLAPWQKTKLQTQAKLFGKQKLVQIYNNLFQIEIGQKTGDLSAPLISTIDFLLIEI